MSTHRWTQIGFARVAEVLASTAGLRFAPARQPAAEQAMLRVMERAGLHDAARFADRVAQDPELLDALLAEVTIGETYFFREPAQLEFIRRSVLPSLRTRPDDRPVRLWSAGCATGEEPYTLGIIVSEDLPGTRARIVGTEVSRPRIAAARHARYGRWSLRSLAEPVIRRYFTQHGPLYALRPDIRAMVDFGYLNLAHDDYPGGPLDLRDMDVVLCRNVLIYFDRETVATVAERLLASLSEDGWLFLGASDPPLTGIVPCEVVVTGSGLAYRRPTAGAWPGAGLTTVAAPVSPLAAVAAQGLYTTLQEGLATAGVPATHGNGEDDALGAPLPVPAAAAPDDPVPAAARQAGMDGGAARARAAYLARDYAAAAIASGDDPELRVLQVRALANVGALAEAGRACAAALDTFPTHAELAYLHALLLAEAGRLVEALAAVRGALFLDRRLVVAHMLLGTLLARLEDAAGARRAFENADRLLAGLPPDAPVPASDGEPVRRIREAARVQHALLIPAA